MDNAQKQNGYFYQQEQKLNNQFVFLFDGEGE
jgi:hypothetical protein